jgi:hypothetical protein
MTALPLRRTLSYGSAGLATLFAVHAAQGEGDKLESLLWNRFAAILTLAVRPFPQSTQGFVDLDQFRGLDLGQAGCQVVGGACAGPLDNLYGRLKVLFERLEIALKDSP